MFSSVLVLSAGSVGGWSCVLPFHTCKLSGLLRQLFKERVPKHSMPECRPLRCLLRQIPWVLPVILVQPGSAYLRSSTLGLQADFHLPQDAQQPKNVRSPLNCLTSKKHIPVYLKLTSPPGLLIYLQPWRTTRAAESTSHVLLSLQK
ncbi:hypothetical protein AMECASPLE_029075 [Ameca splendens]|uniref:Secreted protein n=1 Tax=Ameca splendens TaxID=208324 RepID=A0ABV0YSX3_9TELE